MGYGEGNAETLYCTAIMYLSVIHIRLEPSRREHEHVFLCLVVVSDIVDLPKS